MYSNERKLAQGEFLLNVGRVNADVAPMPPSDETILPSVERIAKPLGWVGMTGVRNASETTPKLESSDTDQRAREGVIEAAKKMHSRGRFTAEYAISLVEACGYIISLEDLHQAVNGKPTPVK